MKQERAHIPFPEIPFGYFDGEEKPILPTYRTTVLFDPLEKIVLADDRLRNIVESGGLILPPSGIEINPQLMEGFRYLADWAIASNSDSRRRAKSKINNFCNNTYPTNYQALAYLISVQQNNRNTALSSGLEELTREIEYEYKPLTNVRLRFYFEPHSVETQEEYEDVKNELRSELLGIFVKGEKNIFLQERVSRNKQDMEEDDRLWADGLEKYKSFLMTLIYSDFLKNYKRPPSDPELYKHLERIKGFVRQEMAPKFSYHLLTAEVLDEFVARGYEINEEFEKTILPSIAKYKDDNGDARNDTFSTFKNSILYIHRTSKSRNLSIIKQASEIAQCAEEDGKKTNIFIRLGTNHALLLKSLPIRLQKATVGSSVVPLTTPNKNVDRLFRIFFSDLQVDEKTWKLAYEETKRNKLNALLEINDP